MPRQRKLQEDNIRYNYNDNPFDPSLQDPDAASFPLLNSKQLSAYTAHPRRFQALTRDFIHDSLYNPHYGYFTQQAVIFDTQIGLEETKGFEFNNLRNNAEFDRLVAERYGEIEGTNSAVAVPGTAQGSARQIWHTPSELFKPWYARAIANFILDAHKRTASPEDDLVIYEIGAGNGTMMQGVLDYIAERESDLFERTRYTTIEVSPRLAKIQAERGRKYGKNSHVVQSDILDYVEVEERPCFVLAFEVLDNLAHDIIRFTKDPSTPQQAVQCTVAVSSTGDFTEQYTAISDPLISEYLDTYQKTGLSPLGPSQSSFIRHLLNAIPFSANLSPPIFLPTQMFALLRKLYRHFPKHRLLVSDFDKLPDTVEGQNGPRVQTRYLGDTVPCTTYLVSPGYFDIFFPTDFAAMQALYSQIRGSGQNKLQVASHKNFLKQWADIDQTKLKNGENPMLEYYSNVSFAWTA